MKILVVVNMAFQRRYTAIKHSYELNQ